jgi:hypothetical protein
MLCGFINWTIPWNVAPVHRLIVKNMTGSINWCTAIQWNRQVNETQKQGNTNTIKLTSFGVWADQQGGAVRAASKLA